MAQRTTCSNNLKQLTLGWILYSGDQNDSLPPNHEDYASDQLGSISASPSWVTGNAFTDTTSSNIQRGLLYQHVNADATYRCPSDRSTVRDAGKLSRTRHYGLSVYMNGTGNAATPDGETVTELIFRKQSSIHAPDPAQAFVFIDTHPKHLAGGGFGVLQPGFPDRWNWAYFPDARHENGANLSFADGHVEHWRWRESKTLYWAKNANFEYLSVNPGDRDLSRVQECIPHAKR